MHFLTAAFPGTGVDLLKDPEWDRPVNLLKVLDMGYTYAQSTSSRSRRKKKATSKPKPNDVPAPDIPVSELRQMIASRHPTQLQIGQWDFDGQCRFESSRLTAEQLDLCIRRGILVSSHVSSILDIVTKPTFAYGLFLVLISFSSLVSYNIVNTTTSSLTSRLCQVLRSLVPTVSLVGWKC